MSDHAVDRRKPILAVILALVVATVVTVGLVWWYTTHENAAIAADTSHVAADFVEHDFTVDDARMMDYSTRGSGHLITYFLIRPTGTDILLRATMPRPAEASGLMYLSSGDEIRVRVLQSDLTAAQHRSWIDKWLDYPLNNASRMVPMYRLERDGQVMFERPDTQPNRTVRLSHVSERALIAYILIPLFLIATLIGVVRRRMRGDGVR